MANETKRIFHGTTTTLEANGASTANNVLTQANDASLNLGSYTSPAGYPNVRFVLSFTFATAPLENSMIKLIARPLNIDGTNDAQAPEASFLEKDVGYGQRDQHFPVNNVTTAQYAVMDVHDAPWEADYYIFNAATGQTISAGWTLKATPFTYGPV